MRGLLTRRAVRTGIYRIALLQLVGYSDLMDAGTNVGSRLLVSRRTWAHLNTVVNRHHRLTVRQAGRIWYSPAKAAVRRAGLIISSRQPSSLATSQWSRVATEPVRPAGNYSFTITMPVRVRSGFHRLSLP